MKKTTALAAALSVALLGACTAEVEDPGEAPTVNVEGGRAPEVDIDPARVEVGTDTQVVEVPDVDVEPANRNP